MSSLIESSAKSHPPEPSRELLIITPPEQHIFPALDIYCLCHVGVSYYYNDLF